MNNKLSRYFMISAVVGFISYGHVCAAALGPGVNPEDVARPGSVAQPKVSAAPTANLARLAGALKFRSKSVTTEISLAPGLGITRPVEISVGYYSPAGNNRITQNYNAATGNVFSYSDYDGDMKSRQMNIAITLSENTGQAHATHAVRWQVTLQPLYDISISPLRFGLLSACDWAGSTNEIRLYWFPPDRILRHLKFNAYISNFVGEGPIWKTIPQFAWSRTEVDIRSKLGTIDFFWSDDDGALWYFTSQSKSHYPHTLVFGKSEVVDLITKERSCSARVQYTITQKVHRYSKVP